MSTRQIKQPSTFIKRKDLKSFKWLEAPVRKYIMKREIEANSLEINVDCDDEPESAPQKGLYMNERYQCLKN